MGRMSEAERAKISAMIDERLESYSIPLDRAKLCLEHSCQAVFSSKECPRCGRGASVYLGNLLDMTPVRRLLTQEWGEKADEQDFSATGESPE